MDNKINLEKHNFTCLYKYIHNLMLTENIFRMYNCETLEQLAIETLHDNNNELILQILSNSELNISDIWIFYNIIMIWIQNHEISYDFLLTYKQLSEMTNKADQIWKCMAKIEK